MLEYGYHAYKKSGEDGLKTVDIVSGTVNVSNFTMSVPGFN